MSELARIAELDKAATRRFLVSLEKHGFIEQNAATKKYRLGSAFLRFARIREATFPLASIVQPVLDRLATTLGETAHASIASGDNLVTIGVAEPQRSTRVYVDPSQLLPIHATASGVAYLAFAPEEARELYLQTAQLERHTNSTVTSVAELRKRVKTAMEEGFYMADRSFEDDVIGIAAPVFDWSGQSFGAISVASIASRMTDETRALIASSIVQAAVEITRSTGAEPHPSLLRESKD